MNIFIPLILATQLLGGFMETKLAEGIYLNTWHCGSKTYAQVCNNGKYSPEYVVRCSPDDYISVKAITGNFARATYSDGTTKILHVVDGCITVLDEGENK